MHDDVFDHAALSAVVEEADGVLFESARGFIVPDDWRERAAARQR